MVYYFIHYDIQDIIILKIERLPFQLPLQEIYMHSHMGLQTGYFHFNNSAKEFIILITSWPETLIIWNICSSYQQCMLAFIIQSCTLICGHGRCRMPRSTLWNVSMEIMSSNVIKRTKDIFWTKVNAVLNYWSIALRLWLYFTFSTTTTKIILIIDLSIDHLFSNSMPIKAFRIKDLLGS